MTGSSPLDVITSYTAYTGRMSPLPQWVGQGAILGLQGGTQVSSIVNHFQFHFVCLPQSVLDTLDLVKVWGNMSDVVGVWLQDWTGQRVFGDNSHKDLPRVGLWWNWEVMTSYDIINSDVIVNDVI